MNPIEIKDLKKLFKETTRHIEEAQDHTEVNKIVENLVTTVVGSEFASFWIFDRDRAMLVRERNDGTLREISMLGQQGILAKCFFTISGGIYNYLASEKGYVPSVDNPDNIKIKSKILVPIIDGDNFLGMVTAYSSVRKIKNFEQSDMALLEAMVPFLTQVIYRMHPHMRTLREEVYMSERLLAESEQIVQKVEEIREETQQDTVPKDDATEEMMRFMVNAVHDIRTPANTLQGFLELLEEEMEDQRLLQYIRNAKESAYFINELTTSILDHLSSGKKESKEPLTTISPVRFFADIAEGFSPNMHGKDIDYTIYIDPLLPKEVMSQPNKLKRIMMNLLNNAYKFTPSGKSIDLTVKYDTAQKTLSVAVTDTGIGIAEEKQQEIFEAFKQADENIKKQHGGTGLGLNITSVYVSDLGGELKLKSRLDEGSSFYFTIPLEVSNPAPTFPLFEETARVKVGMLLENKDINSSKTMARYMLRLGMQAEQINGYRNIFKLPDNLTHLICFENLLDEDVITYAEEKRIALIIIEKSFLSSGSPKVRGDFTSISRYGYFGSDIVKFIAENRQKRILIADDDRINVELLQAILANEFCSIETAQDGESALSLLQEAIADGNPYSLAFLDRHMPKLSGPELLEQVRLTEKMHPDVSPLYAVSISGDGRSSGKEKLFDMQIGKPFSKKKIKQALEEAFSR